MRFINVKFIKSASNSNGFIKDELPQVALVGRSNVGKSSLINLLTNNKKMAKTSSTPGRTRLVNYFNVNEEFYLVDLPGYGYNQASKTTSNSWDKLLNEYFVNNYRLKIVLLLLDSRLPASNLDKDMLDYLAELEIPVVLILTKTDKITRNQLNINIQNLSEDLRFNKDRIIITSSIKKSGVEEIAKLVEGYIK